MARRRHRGQRRRLQRANLETRVRYGPELRGLRELAADARHDYHFDVDASRGAAEGIIAGIDAATPRTRQIYDRAAGALDTTEREIEQYGGLEGLFADATHREHAGAEERLTEARAGALSDLVERKVGAEEGRAYAVQNAAATYHDKQDQIGRQKQGLRGDMGAFKLATLRGLADADRDLAMERRRIRLSERTERRQSRKTEADITGTDPSTGLPTAQERNRVRDDRRQARKDKQKNGKNGLTRGQITDHQGIVGDIQDARRDAQELRRIGAHWNEVRQGLHASKSDDNPYGGHGPLVTQAGVELARYGHMRSSTIRALRARGFLPKRAPRSWKPTPRSPSLVPRNSDGTPG